MKLHLNLTLRRALMAAMAMVALHTADAALTTQYNGLNAYIYGDGTFTSNTWNDIWNKHKSSTLTIGNYQGAAIAELEGSTYNKGKDVYIGGVGYDSNTSVANNGELIVNKQTQLHVNVLNAGNSQVGGTGTLTVKGGAVTADTALYVGVNAGSGIVNVTDGGSITVASGSTGAVFAMSHRNISGLADTVTLTGSTITVGAKGGVVDYTAIGHSAGTATLNLKAGSTATFHDQLLVGEMSGNGTIYVTGGSTLNMGSTTVLGAAAGATGLIRIEDGTAQGADTLVIGSKGTGKIEMLNDKAALAANSIELGDAAGSMGTITAQGGRITTDLLTIGTSGSGSVVSAATITTKDIIIGKEATGYGELTIKGKVTTDTLYAGEKGTGIVSVESGTLTVTTNAYIVGINSELATEAGKTTLTNATVLAGELSTAAGAETKVNGELILDEAGQLENAGTTYVASAKVAEGAGITATGGKLTIDTLVNSGKVDVETDAELEAGSVTNNATITNAGTLVAKSMSNFGTVTNSKSLSITELENAGTITNTNTLNTGSAINKGTITNDVGTNWYIGDLTSTEGSIANNGTITSTGKVVTGAVTTDGSGNWINNGSWTITGQTEVTVITNNKDKDITITGAGRIVGNSLTGEGTTTIAVDKTTVNGIVVDLTQTPENKDAVKVTLDMSNTAGLVGKDLTFLRIGTLDATADNTNDISLVNADQDSKGINWAKSYIDINGTSNKLWFTSNYANNAVSQMKFTKMAELIVEENLGEITYIDPDTKEEKTASTSVTLDYEMQTLANEEKTLDTNKKIDEDLADAIGVATGSTTSAPILQTVSIDNASSTADTTAGDGEAKIGIVVGAGVDSTSLAVQTVVVKQVTKDEKGNVLSEEAIDSTGMALVLEGTSKHEGKGDKENNHLGFADELNGKVISAKDDNNNSETKKTQTIDLVQVGSNASVTLTNLNMHSTHTLEVKKGATITFDGVNMKVGGSLDTAIKTETVQVEVKDENGDALKDSKGNIITKEVTVENKNAAHLDTGSVIGDTETDPDKATETKVIIKGGSEVAFEKVYSADDKVELGTTTITGAKTEVVMDGEDTTLGMDSVVKEKDDQGKDKEKHGQKIVFSNGSHLKGNGNLKNIHIDKDSYFTVGSSPGKFSASELTVDGKTSFYIITDSNDWLDYAKTNTLSSDKRQDGAAPGNWGAISQLEVKGSVTLNGQVTFIYQHFDDAAGEFVTEDTATAREKMKKYFKEGSSIKFVTYNGGSLTLGENFSVDLASLPELEDGLFWDVNSLFTENTVYVMAEILEEPSRIANTLVSAGETVLNFGRLAEAQASLREAGTTRTWGSAIAMFDSIDSGSTTNGYDYSNWGAAVGIDHAFTKNTVVGVAFGCTWGENEAKEDNGYYSAGSIDQDAKMIGIYGVHKFQTKGLLNDVKLSAFAAYGMFENDSTRNGLNSGNTAKAEWDSDAWVLSASLSRDITTDSGVVFTPYVGVEYTTAGMDDFSEQGKSYSADYSADEDYSNLSVKVGVSVSKTYGSITPYANVAFISDIDRTAGEVTATGKRTITGKSALPGRNGFEIGVGATWQLTENLDVNAGYSAEIRDKATEHNARLGVGYTF